MIDDLNSAYCLDGWVGPKQLEEEIGYSRNRQKYLRKIKRLPYAKLGSYILYYLPDIDTMFECLTITKAEKTKRYSNSKSNCGKLSSERKTWISPKELEYYLYFSTNNQYKMRKMEILPYAKDGKYIRYKVCEIIDVITSHIVVSIKDVCNK